jgi:cell division GTPase FtsZ
MADGIGQRDQGLDDMTEAVRTITDLLTRVNLVGIDFADVRTVLHRDGLAGAGGGGVARFGTGEASGPDRGVKAVEAALLDLKRRWSEQ